MNKKYSFKSALLIGLGVIVGSVFHDRVIPVSFASEPESVAATQYQKCLTMTAPRAHMGAHFNNGRQPVEDKMVSIPGGWTPVGGFGIGNGGRIILCK